MKEKMITEEEVELAVKKWCADNNLPYNVQIDEDIVYVEVERKDFDRALELDRWFDEFSIQITQKIPDLVQANVGDLVLIFNEYKTSDDYVGFVSSKFTEPDGSVYYGCRYILLGIGNSFLSSSYDFELTEENYGGYPSGFLKVINTEEAFEILNSKIDIAFEKATIDLKEKYSRSKEDVNNLFRSLKEEKVIKCETVNIFAFNSRVKF